MSNSESKNIKVLYIGHLRDGSGWTRAACDLIQAMDYVGIDVSCRSILLSRNIPPNKRIQELEAKRCKNPDVIIQHVLPHFYEKNGPAKHIGYFVGEGSSFSRIGWQYRLNLMDEIWVPNRDLLKVKTYCPKHVVHHAHNKALYFGRPNKLIDTDSYKFYSIIDFTDRKNLRGLLEAFHLEFDRENVDLVIKLSSQNLSKEEIESEFHKLNNDVCSSLRKWSDSFRYKQVMLISDHLSEGGIRALHSSCDCYVSLSHGEAWNYPLADSIFHGNDCIASSCEGHKEFVPLSSGILISGKTEPAKNKTTLPFYQTGVDTWFSPDIIEARQAMRQKFNESQKTAGFIKRKDKLSKTNRDLVDQFSFETIGNRILELL